MPFMKKHFRQGSVAINTLLTSKVLLLRLFLQASTLIVLAKTLGASSFGIFAGLSAAAVLAGSLSTLGMHFIVLRASARDEGKSASIVAEYALWTTLVAGVLMLFLYLFALSFINLGANRNTAIALGIAETVIQPFILLSCMEYQAKNQIARSQAILTLPIALRCASVFLLAAWPSENVESIYAGLYLASSAISLLVAIRLQPRKWPTPKHWRRPTMTEVKSASGFAVQNATTICPSEADKTIAAKLLTSDIAGHYSLSARLISAATLPVMALMISVMPSLFGEKNRSAAKQKTLAIFTISGLYGLLLATTTWHGAPLIGFAFGSEYAYLSEILPHLSVFAISLSFRISGTTILTTQSMPLYRSAIEGIGVITLIILSISLIPKHGVIGLCIAATVSETTMAAMAWTALIMRSKNE